MLGKDNLSQQLITIYSRISLQCKSYLDNDPLITREDTCKGILALLEQLRAILIKINQMKIEERAKQYHVTYNAINYILDMSEHIRKTTYSFEIIAILIEAIKSMQENFILNDVKYLDKRTELYLKTSKIYEQWQYYQEAVNILDAAIKSYKNIKALHDQDPPVPDYVNAVLNNNIKLVKIFWIKYNIQAGSLIPADWRKKVDQQFGDDNQAKLTCLIETLKTQTKKHANIFTKNMKNFKENLLQSGYDMIKGYMQLLTKGLNQQKQKIERQVTFRSNMNATQQEINQEIKKKRQMQDKFVRQSQLKKASQSFPIQYHAELIHYALQIKSAKILSELIQSAKVRIHCRRIQVPYVNDIMIVVSNSPYPNVPNGYTKIPIDLNEANMIKELIKLRKSGKKPPEDESLKSQPNSTQPAAKDDKKDSKKGGKQAPPPPPANKQNDINKQPTQWQLNQIKHKYVFMMIKKSMSPQEAIYDLRVVLGNQETGPVGYVDNRRIIVPYIQQNMKIMQSEVSQHTGVRQTTGLVPYIILYHSRNSLQSDQQKRTLITDVAPLIGKNPIVPPKWGYNKVDTDLRQVPLEYIKAPNHDYVYLTYKTDELFHLSQRHIQIIRAFVELENTYGQKKGVNADQEKCIELQLNYSLQKLDFFFQTVQECLKGDLGREYFEKKSDFLTNLIFQIWTKYLKNPLTQFDYMRQQRLNEEIIDYDYSFYKTILEKASSVMLRGLKVLNLIMVSNPRADILLQSKISLQLSKLLQQSRFYKMAAENIKLTLDKLRQYRDQYLSKGVQGAVDKILPFSITCSNSEIKSTIQKMRKKYKEQRRLLQKVLRINDRKAKGLKPLTPEELEEQEKQYIRLQKPDKFDETIEKVNTSHSQVYAIICAIELDLSNIYFRVSLKRSEEVAKLEGSKNDMTMGIKNSELQGLAATTKQKLNLSVGPTQTKNQQNLAQLQNTLVKANQLPTPKPKLQRMQNKLIAENQKNPYSMALLYVNLAAMNSDNKDKRYYLQQALNSISSCKQLQKSMLEHAIENAIFIFSGLWDNKVCQDQNSQKIAPFKDLYSNIWQTQTQRPEPPILISKNSTAVQVKLPPFVLKHSKSKQQKKVIKLMSVYGKPSANGVDVSLNCTQLQGTGIRNEIGKTVKISQLSPNNTYCFAVAGIDQNQEVLSIGKTGEDVGTFNPLSISMLASYLAKISYQVGQYQICEKAVKIILSQFCKQTKYTTLDQRTNNLSFYSLNEERIKSVSIIELKSISQSFYVAALCERRRLKQSRQNQPNKPKIFFQQKQKLITNLLLLSASLSPSLSSPNISIPFLIPQNEVLLRGVAINMIPQKWMNPKIRKLGAQVMQKLLKWGLQNNEINLARKLVYKWNERKYLIMGKMIQIEQKKQVKKGAKDSKDQQVKMIDKYCRIMIEKSPQMMDAFEDSMITISEEYYDFVSLFVQKAKEQLSLMSQYVDNPSEQMDAASSHLNLKLELLQYLKEPLQSIKKIGNTSPYYLEYNSKILKKALQIASETDYKALVVKSQELDVPEFTDQIKLSKEIYEIIFSAIRQDIAWCPASKMQLIQFQKNTGKDLKKAIDLFTNWETKKKDLTIKLQKCLTLQNKYKDFDYLNMWMSQLYHLKSQCNTIVCCNDFIVKRKIKVRYDKIKSMNLQDLFKKQKEVLILEAKEYSYTEEQIKKLTQLLSYSCQAIYSSLVVQNWLKLQSVLKFLCNFICYIQITPFYHKNTQIWTYFAFISLCAIEMLQKIKKNGFNQFKHRYNIKMMNTERANINEKLQLGEFVSQPLIQQFFAEYYQPDLDSNTTKSFWFNNEKHIDIEAISSIIAYTVNTLRLQNKYNLVINIVRDFCNVTQHYFSLMLLPFMTNSQQKLLQEVQKMYQKQNTQLIQITNVYNAQKQKAGKKRAYLMSGQKMQFQKVYEQKSQKIKSSLKFLQSQKSYIESQIHKSNRIKDEITRDSSKQVLAQQEQKKYTIQFGEDYESMFRKFGQEAKHVKKTKNFIKDIINKYDSIYEKLKNNKTSKDTLAQIQNRNDVGNLWFASGHLDKAFEFWNDSLATIFKKVNPIDNYKEILAQNKPYLVKNIGQKQTILAICLLYKVSNFACGSKLQFQKASTHFACHLAFSLFEANLTYPQTYEIYKDYRIKSFPARQIFVDQNTINLTQLLSALEYFIFKNLYDEHCIECLPLVTFYEYLGTDVVKNNQISIKAKIYKSLLLSESGFISQSITYLTKVSNQKDLPILWLQNSDYLKKEKGMNWVQDGLSYNNSQLWTNNDNKLVIQQFKKLTMRPESALQYGIFNPQLFTYAKSLTLFKIYQNELSKDEALNQQRLQVLNQVESILRQTLKKCGVIQQFYSLLEEYQVAKLNYSQNQVSDELKKDMQTCRSKMLQYLKKNNVDQSSLKIYERQESSPIKRALRLQFMCQIRYTLHRLSQSRNLLSNSYYILKNSLTNMQRYAYGSRLCQTGYDSEIKPVVVQPVASTGKKDDKKGGKKEQQNVQVVSAPPLDEQKQKQTRTKTEGKSIRTSHNAFWHIKILFELAKILFKQNNMKQSFKLFEIIIQNCKKFQQQYFLLLSRGFIARIKLRLGNFEPQQFKLVVQQLQRKQFYDINYINLVVDFGQLLSGDASCLQYLNKGRKVAESIWKKYGMKSILNGIGQAFPARSYYLKEQPTAQQDQAIKKKKKGQKKAGKDDKKAPPKKEDPKKKKQQSKVEYKVSPLSKVSENSLLQDEKFIFGQYSLNPHPNYRRNNIYQKIALVYIKIYLRQLRQELTLFNEKDNIDRVQEILKLLNVLQSYPFATQHIKMLVYGCLGAIHKQSFILALRNLIKQAKKNYPNLLKSPFEDFPLNKILINIPSYSQFIHKNRNLLVKAKGYFKKCLSLVENSTVFYQRFLNAEQIAWDYADNQCLLAEYTGRDKPKYYLDQTENNLEKRELQYLNDIFESSGFLQFAIKIKSIKIQLLRNYLQIGSKGLDPTVKIDQDISSEITQIDRQAKKKYPQLLIDNLKSKGPITGTDLITYMLKLYREAEVMTFTNHNYQNVIYKCHRILMKSLPGFKQKCSMSSLDVPLRKNIKDKFIEPESIVIKSVVKGNQEVFLYVLGTLAEGNSSYYGRIKIQLHKLSKITEDLLALTSKTALSDKKSQAVKNRDYRLHREQFKRILVDLSARFGNAVIDGAVKTLPTQILPELTPQNLSIFNKMFDHSGLSSKSKDVCRYLRKLHEMKYQQ